MIVVTARTLIEDVAPTEPEGTKPGGARYGRYHLQVFCMSERSKATCYL